MRDAKKPNPFSPIDQEAVGQRLELIRVFRGYTQEQIARRLGTDKSSWNRWEQGQRLIKVDVADRIFQLWNIDHAYIYRGKETDLPGAFREFLERRQRSD